MLGSSSFMSNTEGPRPTIGIGVEAWDDFTEGFQISATANAAKWLLVDVANDAVPASVLDAHGGVAELASDTGANDDGQAQMNGEAFAFDQTDHARFTCRYKIEDVSEDETIIGVCGVAADLTGSIGGGSMDGVGFYTDESGVINYFIGDGTNDETGSTGVTTTDDTWIEASFALMPTDGGTQVVFWVGDENTVPTLTNQFTASYVPTGGGTLSFGIQTTDTGGDWIRVDYIGCRADR